MKFTQHYFNLGYTLQKQSNLKQDVTLQPHQKNVLSNLSKEEIKGLLLFHGLGSGKTLSAIASTSDGPTDFVVPASLRENARKEFKKFTNKNQANVRSYEDFRKKGPSRKYKNLVLDEAHRISNPEAMSSKALINNAHKYNKKVLLSGSPIKNHPYDLAPLLGVIDPSQKLMSKDTFHNKFIGTKKVNPGFWGWLKGVKPGEEEYIKNVPQFKQLWEGKVDYHAGTTTDFPDVTEKDVTVEMSPNQKKIYNKALEGIPYSVRAKMEQGIPLSRSEKAHINHFFNASRQISNSIKSFGEAESTPKVDKMVKDIKKTLNSNKNAKTVTYSNYLDSGVNEIANELEKNKIPYGVFSGSLTDKKRKALVDDYNSGKIKSLLVSGAGSEGLDLKGTRLMQIMEPHWNEARTDQMKGRAIRYKSHSHLPKKDQHVEVRNYMSVLPKETGFFSSILGSEPDKSTDEYMRDLGKKKTELNSQFLNILKELGSRKK